LVWQALAQFKTTNQSKKFNVAGGFIASCHGRDQDFICREGGVKWEEEAPG
jgi:hypothetical protein